MFIKIKLGAYYLRINFCFIGSIKATYTQLAKVVVVEASYYQHYGKTNHLFKIIYHKQP